MSIKYKKFEPTEYVMRVKNGEIVQEGLGLSFFYNTRTTSMMVLPTTASDTGFAFDQIITSDFQSVSVQGDISYIITDYRKAAQMVDFSYRSTRKENEERLTWAKQKMAKRILNLAKVYVTKFISTKNVRTAIVSGDALAAALRESMKKDETMREFGLELDAGKMENDIRLEEENRKLVDLQTENERKKSDARAYDSEVLLKTFAGVDAEIVKALAVSGMDSKALIAKAFAEIGDKADKIGVLNVSPECRSSTGILCRI